MAAKKKAKKKVTSKKVAKKTTTAKKKVAKKATKKAPKKAAMEMLLVGSKTKEVLKASGCNVSSDALEGLNKMVYWYLDQAAKRAVANGRKTIRAHDFLSE